MVLFVSACGSLDLGESPLQTEEGDRAKLVEMRGEISALIGDAECETTEDCRQVGIGAKPCGGPWDYLIYSVTDSAALADRQINVEELTTRRVDAPMSGEPMFEAQAIIRVPDETNLDTLSTGLESIASDLMVDLTLEPSRPSTTAVSTSTKRK